MIERWKDRAKDLSSGVFRGFRAADGRFEEMEHGHSWLVFKEPEDVVLWCPFNEQIALFEGRSFALNELAIENAATYSLGVALVIHGSIRNWILANGQGIFVVDWRRAFHMLHRAPRVMRVQFSGGGPSIGNYLRPSYGIFRVSGDAGSSALYVQKWNGSAFVDGNFVSDFASLTGPSNAPEKYTPWRTQ
ncbi:hypothetical protein AGRO_0752 [Agrobacterium sp. ATCC 31749]|uniref:hypothetical protein n=1 Tax=unclassified Agrobacterium TaxID=2632611 RepID=UPI00020DBB20|nr:MULTISPECIES: hypothetical protein [unclassified Agrobacterium]EGL66507.1 hypothetical protein AGRO_0752 [Agrobacterium sp. ATCC 31749]